MRKSFKSLAAIAIALGVTTMVPAAAHADPNLPPTAFFQQMTTAYNNTGYCEAAVTREAGDEYAFAEFTDNNSGFTCVFWIERSTYSNGSWSGYTPIGSYATNPVSMVDFNSGPYYTSDYYDYTNYRFRAAFYMTDNKGWTGVTHHTDPV